MASNQLTKDDIRAEIKKENKKYRKKRRWSTFAVILVLVAVILLLVFADGKGLLGSGNGFGTGDGSGFGLKEKAINVLNKASDKIDSVNKQINSNNKEVKVDVEDNQGQLAPEGTEEVIIDDTTIVVSDVNIIYENVTYTDTALFKEALLKKEFTSQDVLTLRDDKAIMSTYEAVKNILEEMQYVNYIEE